ncbi:hypothetical protein NEOKW01_1596 [Nematocida sp. AWRm80]|nr:hypothetical protein NEOKW01_1596 [Nematocida sp. AWRm80]
MTKKGSKGKEAMKPKDAKKAVDEQMFGMKNKGKSTKLKKMASALEASYTKGKGKKPEEKPKETEMMPVYEVIQKIPVGVDPKTVLCTNFKNGVCSKGTSCKFSHETNPEKRIPKTTAETGTSTKPVNPATSLKDEKICKYYIDALKTGKYNPKWVCPIGNTCQSKHSPPEGYSLKDEAQPEITIEDYIEIERHKLPEKQTPMTEELFHQWKKERELQKEKERKDQEKIKEGNIQLGKLLPTGKDLFVYKPDVFVDDEEALDCDYNAREELPSDEEDSTVLEDIKNITISKQA